MQPKSMSREQGSVIPVKSLLYSLLIPIALYFFQIAYRQVREEHSNDTNHPTNSSELFVWSDTLQDWSLLDVNHHDNNPIYLQKSKCLWPEDCPEQVSDRIISQLKLRTQARNRVFRIFMSNLESERDPFEGDSCFIRNCQMVYNPHKADALIFPNSDVDNLERLTTLRSQQIWIAYLLESPTYTFDKRFPRRNRGRSQFNWTASYRSDSDIVTPYSKFVVFSSKSSELKETLYISQVKRSLYNLSSNPDWLRNNLDQKYEKAPKWHKSLIKSKSGKVAWLASNCYAKNNRLEYARQLGEHIQVDIYGRCGGLTCAKWNQTGCSNMINKHYKFYLAFENSNCFEYITEKLYRNAFNYNDLDYLVLPIVMGPSREDYKKLAPPDSFIHVDDFESVEDLAKYLKRLNEDDALFYSYFRWKTLGKFIDTKFMCRVCALLNESYLSGKKKIYKDIKKWWNNKPDHLNEKDQSSCK